jgi:hypothetical protein
MYKEGLFERARTRPLVSLLGIVCLAVMSTQAARAESVTLAWNPSVTPGVTGYNLYYGTSSHNYSASVSAGSATNLTVSGLTAGINYFFAVTAYDSFGIESDFSVETNYVPVATGNTPPTISTINDQVTVQDSSVGPISFTVGDAETAAGSLTLSASSSVPSLLPVANITFGGSGSNRTVMLVPAAGQSGNANVTITVSDGSLTANTTFQLTVISSRPPPNTPPFISAITNVTILTNTVAGPIPFTVGDAESGASTLTLKGASSNPSLVPTNGIVFGGSGSNRTVTLTPASGQAGMADITLFVSDGTDTSSNTFTLTVKAPGTHFVTIKSKGKGKITPNLNGQPLAANQVYTVTATPDPGQQFSGWNGSMTSSRRIISFVLNSDLTLEADFDPASIQPDNNTYSGLFFEPDEVRLASSGAFSVRTTTRNSYSGKLKLNGKQWPFTGSFAADGQATNTIVRRTDTTLTLVFHLGAGDQIDQIFGTLSDGNWSAVLSGDRAQFNARNPAPYAGNYTMILPGNDGTSSLPTGDSYGAVRISIAGLALFSGTLGDGTKVSQTAPISKEGLWPFYAPLYASKGSLLGWVTVSQAPADQPDLSGLVSWIKPAVPTSRYYSSGFTTESMATGSLYSKPGSPATPIVSLETNLVSFTGGDLGADFNNAFTLGLYSKVTNLNINRMTLTFSLGNGTFKGTVADPNTGAVMPFGGAVLQKFNNGSGSLMGGVQSSRVILGNPPPPVIIGGPGV